MKNREELDIMILDIETYLEMTLVGGYIPSKGNWVLFEISKRKNDLDAMVKFLLETPFDYYISYNGVLFDFQVLQYIIDNHSKWFDKSWIEVTGLVYSFVQDLISNQDYEIQPPYKEQFLDLKTIDLFLILHYNNQNKRTSLKWCMYSMDEDIEVMSVDHGKSDLTDQEIEDTIYYWRNDIKATHTLYKYCIGETEHPDYKGKDKIQLRLDLIEEMKLPAIAINWNDVKIGDELNKKNYLELSGISQQKLWEKVKNRKTKTGFTFGDCFPKYWKFETKEFKEFFKKIKDVKVNLNLKQEFPFSHKGTNYTFGRGGGHSCESARIVTPAEDEVLIDCDCASMYPNIIRKRNIYPEHLGAKWNIAYVGNIPKRVEAKTRYKKTGIKKDENIAESFKYVLNGNFGKLIERTNWQYDPFAGIRTTVGGQIDIFMLAEDFEVNDHHVVSMNTDGLTVLVKKNKLEGFYEICANWEIQTESGKGNLEYVEYEKLIQLSVNDYIAIKKGDEPIEKRTKRKGDFLTSYELHKNKSKSIVPIALDAYFTKGIPISETIGNHRNIFDFCLAKKASRDYSYEGIDKKTGKINVYNRLIRYYTSSGTGEKLWKVKKPNSEKTGPARSQCESTSDTQVIFNTPFHPGKFEDYKIDYGYYEKQTYRILDQIEQMNALIRKEKEGGILTLF